jgi:hypothetical protein
MEKGIFGLGSVDTDKAALSWVMERNGPSTSNRPVVIIGNALEVVICAGSLLKEGCDAERITLVIKEENLESIGQSSVSVCTTFPASIRPNCF